MKARIVRIGNSRGIRIPKAMIEQCGFGDTVELRVENESLVIARLPLPRQGWEQVFQNAGSAENDELLMEEGPLNEFDREEWEW